MIDTAWQPIERAQIKAGMRIRVTAFFGDDHITTHVGVAHYADHDGDHDGDWRTRDGWLLTGWADPTTYEVDPSTIPNH